MAGLRVDFDRTARTMILHPRGGLDISMGELARTFADQLHGDYDVLIVDGADVDAVAEGALVALAELAARLRPLGTVFAFRGPSLALVEAVDASALFPAAPVIDLRAVAAVRAAR
ncbi:MAG: hypothetical protein ABIV94_09280 [Acidimicrobiales bacterium]